MSCSSRLSPDLELLAVSVPKCHSHSMRSGVWGFSLCYIQFANHSLTEEKQLGSTTCGEEHLEVAITNTLLAQTEQCQ